MADTPKTITFHIEQAGGPIESFQPDKLSPEHCKMFEMVGRIVVLWTQIERDVSFIFGRFHDAGSKQWEIPGRFKRRTKSLSAKLEFIDYFISDVEQLSIVDEKWLSIRSHIVELSDVRGKLVHWTNTGFDLDFDEMRMKFSDNEKMTEEIKTEYYSIGDLEEIAQRIGNIGLAIMFFRSEVMRIAFGPQYPFLKSQINSTAGS